MTVIEVKRAPGRRLGWCAHLVYLYDSNDEDFDRCVVRSAFHGRRFSGETAEAAARAAVTHVGSYPILFCTRRRP